MKLDERLQKDMEQVAEKMKKLDPLNQIIIASKIDALFERQMIDEAGGHPPTPTERKTA